MTEPLSDLTGTVGRSVDTVYQAIPRQVGATSAWIEWVKSGASGAVGCVVCDSRVETEEHHVAGKFNSDLKVPVCERCHARLSERQNGWDPRWVREGNSPELKQSLILRGLSDLCEERARFEGCAFHEAGKRLRAQYAVAARATA
jgi:hypothetical protein